jgi:hypothetical protein
MVSPRHGSWRLTLCRDNADGEDIEYPPPQPLDGEIDRMMETDNHDNFVLQSDSAALQDHETVVDASKHPASEPATSRVEEGDDVEDLGSEDDEEEEEEEDGEISLDEEELDEEEENDGEDDEEMQDADGAAAPDEDTTMQSIENNGPSVQPVTQTS